MATTVYEGMFILDSNWYSRDPAAAGTLVEKLVGDAGGELLASSDNAALYIGVLIAGSSTLLVVKLFQEHFELDTEPGRLALGMLIFQDIWVIIWILIQPNIQNPEMGPIMMSFLGIAILTILAVLLSNSDATFIGQIIGIVGIFGWTFGAALVVWGILKAVMGIRVSEEEEYEGVDIAECGMEAYPDFVKVGGT